MEEEETGEESDVDDLMNVADATVETEVCNYMYW